MSNLLATVLNSSRALHVYDRVLDVTQNNVANASTPGFARQSLVLEAMPFDGGQGTVGGVWAGDLKSSRNEYAESAVRQRTTAFGHDSQMTESLTALESAMGSTGEGGLAGALSNFYASASNWSVSPNDTNARQEVLTRAGEAAAGFRQTAAAVSQVATAAERQLQGTVGHINSLAVQLQDLNRRIREGGSKDAGVDAAVHATLEDLAQYVDFNAVRQEDGSVTVLVGGQTALVVGDNRYDLSFSMQGSDNGTASAVVASAGGNDITSSLTSGRLGGLLDFRNRVIAGIAGGPGQTGTLNVLAQSFADRVNAIFTSGQVSDGPPPIPGVPILTYDTASPAKTAATLDIDGSVGAADLAAIDPGPPYVSNGIPLRLAALATPTDAADEIGGYTFTEYYGQIGTGIGRELADAKTGQQLQQGLVAQAKQLREQSSGVSLDEEATVVMQFQKSYQAMSRFIKVLDDLSQEALNILK